MLHVRSLACAFALAVALVAAPSRADVAPSPPECAPGTHFTQAGGLARCLVDDCTEGRCGKDKLCRPVSMCVGQGGGGLGSIGGLPQEVMLGRCNAKCTCRVIKRCITADDAALLDDSGAVTGASAGDPAMPDAAARDSSATSADASSSDANVAAPTASAPPVPAPSTSSVGASVAPSASAAPADAPAPKSKCGCSAGAADTGMWILLVLFWPAVVASARRGARRR